MTNVRVLTEAQARMERANLIQAAGGDEARLRARAAAYGLNAEEVAILDQIDGLDYLLDTPKRGCLTPWP